jgi:hypothetical protein
MKRLERGCFQRPVRSPDGKHVFITSAELQWILTGIELESVRKRKRYVAPKSIASYRKCFQATCDAKSLKWRSQKPSRNAWTRAN